MGWSRGSKGGRRGEAGRGQGRVCRAEGRTWAFGMNEMGAMEGSEQGRNMMRLRCSQVPLNCGGTDGVRLSHGEQGSDNCIRGPGER